MIARLVPGDCYGIPRGCLVAVVMMLQVVNRTLLEGARWLLSCSKWLLWCFKIVVIISKLVARVLLSSFVGNLGASEGVLLGSCYGIRGGS